MISVKLKSFKCAQKLQYIVLIKDKLSSFPFVIFTITFLFVIYIIGILPHY